MAGLLAGLVPVYPSYIPHYHVPYSMRTPAAGPRLYELPSDGDEPTRVARQSIDNDILKLQAQIQSLRKRRNGLSAISVLPPELLAKIFIFVRDPNNDRCAPTQWLRVAHVCHHWREVALSCPSLWSIPIFTNPDLAQEMLLRSKKAALTIEAPMAAWTPRLMDQLESALQQFNRIRTLKLQLGGNAERLQKLISSFTDSAPVLETVSFATPPYYTHVPTITLPDEAFKQAHQLQTVELDRISISWKCGIFQHSLTELRLKNLRRAFATSTTFTQMLDTLENLPRLQILDLIDSLPSHTTSDYRTSHNITLANLRKLCVTSNTVDCAAFLREVRFSANTQIKLRCTTNVEEDPEVYVTILSRIGQLTQSSSESTRPKFPSAILSCSASGGARVELHQNIHARIGSSNAYISILFHWDYVNAAICNRVWGDMCTKLDFSQVQQLVVEHTPDNSDLIAETIGRFPMLSTLDLSDADMNLMRIACAIMEDWDKVPVSNEAQEDRYSLRKRRKSEFIFPSVTRFTNLKVLKISRANFSEKNSIYPLTPFDKLTEMLMQRCDADSPIERLELDSCIHLQEWKLKRFGELVIDLCMDQVLVDIRKLSGQWEESEWDDSDEDDDYDDGDHFYDDYYGGYSDDDLGFFDLF